MKTFSKIFGVFFFLSILPTNSIGMGYPQDMFADQVTVRQVSNRGTAKKVHREKTESRPSACSLLVPMACIQSALPCQNRPPRNTGQRPATDRCLPTNAFHSSRRISVNGVKIFLLNGKIEEEQLLQLEEYFAEEEGAK